MSVVCFVFLFFLVRHFATYLIGMKYTDILGAKRINPNDFGDPLTCHLALPALSKFSLIQ